MVWEKVCNKYIARGKKGTFVVFKYYSNYRGIYQNDNKIEFCVSAHLLNDCKRQCENSQYWEGV